MLRLEKVLKTRDINITLRHKDSFFNPTLCFALLWAVGIHLGGILFFYIAPFKINYTDSLFPPVSVASDLGLSDTRHALALWEEETAIPSYLLLPFTAEAFSHTPSKTPAIKPFNDRSTERDSARLFLSSEIQCISHGCSPVEPKATAPLKIQVSGPLADYPQSLTKEILSPSLYASHQKRNYHLIFDVEVDGKTGQIMWLQPREKQHLALARWGEDVLKSMRFQIPPTKAVVVGRVEILISDKGQA